MTSPLTFQKTVLQARKEALEKEQNLFYICTISVRDPVYLCWNRKPRCFLENSEDGELVNHIVVSWDSLCFGEEPP